jgi:hypothetical protein
MTDDIDKHKDTLTMGYAKTRVPFVTWYTCGFNHVDHAISDDGMADGMAGGDGHYVAICGVTVSVSSLMCPPGRRCSSCQAIVQRIAHDCAPPRNTGLLNRLRGLGRHRDDSQAVAGYRLFGQRK